MKKILSILLIFIVVFSSVVCVYAEEEEVSEREYNRYYINCLYSRGPGKVSSGVRIASGGYSDCDFSINMKLALLKKVYEDGSGDRNGNLYCEMRLYLFDDSNIYLAGEYNNFAKVTDYASYVLHKPTHSIRGSYFFYNESKYEWNNKDIDVERDDSFGAVMTWGTSDLTESGFFHTNIPIFTSEADVMGYINGTVSISEAENFISDIAEITYDSQEVPMPRNLHIEYDNYRYYIVWEFTTDDLKKLTLVSTDGMCMGLKVRYKNIGAYLDFPGELNYDIGFDYFLEPQLSYKIDITDDISALRYAIFEQIGVNYDYKVTLDYYIVSRWDKSELERYFSNFAHVKLYISDSDEGFIVDFDTCITDKNNTVLDDGIFDTDISISTDSSSFIGNIVSAFGLLGDNGLLDCCKAIFSCFPSFIWGLLGAGLSAGIVIFLIKLLFS